VTDNQDFRIDMTFTGRESSWFRNTSIGVAIAGLLLMILSMITNLSAVLLPMNDEYLLVMIPVPPDGAEPLGLTSLMHEIKDKTISVSGAIVNRDDEPIEEIIAVVEMQDTTGRFPQTQEIPVMPVELLPQAMGTFMAMATLQEKPGGYLVKFRFADGGPFIPHKDERAPAISITPQLPK
jgi:hypothetical protein